MDHTICGDEVQTLQFVLQPGHRLTIDMNSICWYSSSLILRARGLFFARLLSVNISIGDATNETTLPAVLSLNQIGGGKILVLKPTKPLYCFRDSFVCATEDIVLSPKVLPFNLSLVTIGISHLFNMAHHCESSVNGRSNLHEGKIFLQSGGTILMKELKADETLVVKFNCMVAFEESCKISITNPFRNVAILFGGKDTFMNVTGPGKIYFCAHNIARKVIMMRSRADTSTSIHSNFSVVGLFLYIFGLGFSLYGFTLLLNERYAE
jgi:uncharacterized protein (AIM24 family)